MTAPAEQAIRTRWASGIVRALKQGAHLLLEVLVFSLVALVVLDLLERAMVSLVEEEQLGVVDDLIDEVVEEPWPGGRALLSVLQSPQSIEGLSAQRMKS